jgi:hypothetical protein
LFRTFLFLSAALLFSLGAHASTPGIALGPAVTSAGPGLQLWLSLIPDRLNLSTGFSTLGLTTTVKIDRANYNTKINLGAIPLVLAFYPFANWFNLQAGVVFDNTRASLVTALPDGRTYSVSGQSYTSAELGTLSGRTHFNPVAPYVGIGFGQPFRGGRLTFTGSVGVMFEGAPNVTLTASNPMVLQIPGVAAEIARQQQEINNKARIGEYYPLVSLGMIYRF